MSAAGAALGEIVVGVDGSDPSLDALARAADGVAPRPVP